MKRFWFKQLIALLIASATSFTLAETTIAADNNSVNQDVGITPIDLVFHGYQGYFLDQGIPSNAAFIWAVQFDRIDAKKLVQSAIAKKRLTPETLNNQNYLRQVQASLKLIERRK